MSSTYSIFVSSLLASFPKNKCFATVANAFQVPQAKDDDDVIGTVLRTALGGSIPHREIRQCFEVAFFRLERDVLAQNIDCMPKIQQRLSRIAVDKKLNDYAWVMPVIDGKEDTDPKLMSVLEANENHVKWANLMFHFFVELQKKVSRLKRDAREDDVAALWSHMQRLYLEVRNMRLLAEELGVGRVNYFNDLAASTMRKSPRDAKGLPSLVQGFQELKTKLATDKTLIQQLDQGKSAMFDLKKLTEFMQVMRKPLGMSQSELLPSLYQTSTATSKPPTTDKSVEIKPQQQQQQQSQIPSKSTGDKEDKRRAAETTTTSSSSTVPDKPRMSTPAKQDDDVERAKKRAKKQEKERQIKALMDRMVQMEQQMQDQKMQRQPQVDDATAKRIAELEAKLQAAEAKVAFTSTSPPSTSTSTEQKTTPLVPPPPSRDPLSATLDAGQDEMGKFLSGLGAAFGAGGLGGDGSGGGGLENLFQMLSGLPGAQHGGKDSTFSFETSSASSSTKTTGAKQQAEKTDTLQSAAETQPTARTNAMTKPADDDKTNPQPKSSTGVTPTEREQSHPDGQDETDHDRYQDVWEGEGDDTTEQQDVDFEEDEYQGSYDDFAEGAQDEHESESAESTVATTQRSSHAQPSSQGVLDDVAFPFKS